MTTPNEQRTRAGYALFLAADPTNNSHWTQTSPLGAVMHKDIQWFDDDGSGGAAAKPICGKSDVLARLRNLRSEMLTCQILSCAEAGAFVHTLDHAVKTDQSAFAQTRPHLCASSFSFDAQGKVTVVRYCSRLMDLHLVAPPGAAQKQPGAVQKKKPRAAAKK